MGGASNRGGVRPNQGRPDGCRPGGVRRDGRGQRPAGGRRGPGRRDQGAVYHHFEDKMALFAAILEESWDTLTASVWAELEGEGPVRERLTAFLVAWLRDLRENERFRALLTITMNGTNSMPAGMDDRAKVRGFHDWHERLARLVSPNAAASLLAWLCGTAMLAAADTDLLPPADPEGVEPLLRGML